MRALEKGVAFHSFIDEPEFSAPLKQVADAAEEGALAGFTVEQTASGQPIRISKVHYVGKLATANVRDFIYPESWGKIGMLITGRPLAAHRNAELTVVPTLADIAEYRKLQNGNPRLIRIIATNRLLGGAVAGAWRASDIREFNADAFAHLSTAPPPDELLNTLEPAGFNWLTIDYSGGFLNLQDALDFFDT